MKALVGTFNQGKALVGAFSVIVKTDGWCAALVLARSQPLPLITHGPVECDNAAWPHVTSHIIMAHTAHIHHNTAATQSYIQYFESLRPGKKDSLIRNTKHILIKSNVNCSAECTWAIIHLDYKGGSSGSSW